MRFAPVLLFCSVVALAAPAFGAESELHHHEAPAAPVLTEPGNDAFAAIQEVVTKLLADPDTDWSRVNLEALRQHLLDMNNFTLNVDVFGQKNIERGVEFSLRPSTLGAKSSLERLMKAHPAVLKQESGWDMVAKKNANGSYTVRVTSGNADDAAKIRGLGYIGLVAYGVHHQEHHWKMASGMDPHAH